MDLWNGFASMTHFLRNGSLKTEKSLPALSWNWVLPAWNPPNITSSYEINTPASARWWLLCSLRILYRSASTEWKKKKNPLVMLGKRSSLETACRTGHQCPYISVQQKKIQACQQPWSNKVRCSHWSQRGRVKETYFEVQTCHLFAMCHYVTPPQQDLVLPINDVIFRGSRCFQIS